MKIGILSRNPKLYSTRRLVEAGRSAGHQVSVVDTMTVAVEVSEERSNGSGVKVVSPRLPDGIQGKRVLAHHISYLPDVDAIIPRIGTSITRYGLAVVRQFEARGVVTTASSLAIAQSRDKLHSLQILSLNRLPTPRTAVVARPAALQAALDAVGGTPLIIKLVQGTQGRGVLLVPNRATAVAVFDRLNAAGKHALVQEYVAEANGQDTRIIVVGDRCVAAMTRTAASGEFRANLHLGGTAQPVEPDLKTQELAVAAAKAHQLGVAGVDIIQSERGPLLLEVNSSPGLEGIEGVTGKNVALEIIRYIEQAVESKERRRSPGRKRRRS